MALSYHYVTSTGAGSKNGGSWANAFDFAAFMSDFATCTAGDIYFFKPGTYTLTADIASVYDGTLSDPIAIIGVKSGTTAQGNNINSDDWATGSDRPFFNGGASYHINVGDDYILKNIRSESEQSGVITIERHGIIDNCYAKCDDAGGTSRYAILTENVGCRIINTEVESPNNRGVALSAGCLIHLCYVHNVFDYGVLMAVSSFATFTICDDVGTGFYGGAVSDAIQVINCVCYDCTNGIYSVAGISWSIIGNIFHTCVTGINWTAASNNNFMWRNLMYNNTTDWNNVPASGDTEDIFCDWLVLTSDPDFVDAPNGDFTLDTGSPALNASMKMVLGVG